MNSTDGNLLSKIMWFVDSVIYAKRFYIRPAMACNKRLQGVKLRAATGK